MRRLVRVLGALTLMLAFAGPALAGVNVADLSVTKTDSPIPSWPGRTSRTRSTSRTQVLIRRVTSP